MYKYRITVFTPTFNRAYILEKLYSSLKRQSFRNFEWLVVDDGSSDNTEQLFNEWKKEAWFPIRYYKTENGGKHRAINRGLEYADGELFFTMDSDDELTTDALEKIDIWFKSIECDHTLCGIVANRGITATETPNPIFKDSYLDKTWLETYYYRENNELKLSGERAIIFYTDVHKKYTFPEFPGEKFLTEAVVYNRIARDGYKLRFFNDIIWIYEYQDDGLTKAGNANFIKNPNGYGLWVKEMAQICKYPFLKRIATYYSFMCDLKDMYSLNEIAKYLGINIMTIRLLYGIHFLRKRTRG